MKMFICMRTKKDFIISFGGTDRMSVSNLEDRQMPSDGRVFLANTLLTAFMLGLCL